MSGKVISFSHWEIQTLRQIVDAKIEFIDDTFGDEADQARRLFKKLGIKRDDACNLGGEVKNEDRNNSTYD